MAFHARALLLLVAAGGTTWAAEPIKIRSVHITLIQQVEVPARQQGLLKEISGKEGMQVKTGDLLARTDDAEVALELEKAKVELAIAKRKAENEEDLQTAQREYEVAARNLERAELSIQKFEGSISDADRDQYKLKADTARNAVEKAEVELELARLNVAVNENKVRLAQARLERHHLTAPFQGTVVEVKRQVGEWVEPGETVLRVIRLDRLRAEGYIPAEQVRPNLIGARVRISTDAAGGDLYVGKVVFVSPEVDRVNRQVRIYAEIDNKDRKLRPGLKVGMTIESR